MSTQPAQPGRRRRGGPPLQVVTPTAPPVEEPVKIPMPAPASVPPTPPPPPIQAPPAAPEPVNDHVVVSKRFDPVTGRPMVAIGFRMRDPNNAREYIVDVPMGEAIAEQIFAVVDDHRARYAPEWFAQQPTLVPQV